MPMTEVVRLAVVGFESDKECPDAPSTLWESGCGETEVAQSASAVQEERPKAARCFSADLRFEKKALTADQQNIKPHRAQQTWLRAWPALAPSYWVIGVEAPMSSGGAQ
jgi:hypothetical protein